MMVRERVATRRRDAKPTMDGSRPVEVRRIGRPLSFELARTAMSAAAARPGSDVLDPLAAHAIMSAVDSVAAVVVLALVSCSEGPVTFGAVVASLGSRVAARFAVLALLGRGAVRVATPGYLTDASLIEARR
ncbi:MAG: hypothetical protein J0J06_11150 [Sphingomonas sp.]|uniref:hypothetical protein n=1 Tax=Sphingomonas sp. TaxID=28214 RepID=UPI001AD49E43|nr:hypothetical protein [Sphingomonas sp.]MBN8815993.1 hypothetical protein [Sphingomonas sp.]